MYQLTQVQRSEAISMLAQGVHADCGCEAWIRWMCCHVRKWRAKKVGRLDNAGMPQMLPHSVRSVPLLDPALCWPLLSARDDRADGRFFVGVASTGIYCRPICPARTPRREHCRFYSTAAGAEAAGYRPCLRCRPELAPGHASVDAPARLAQGAAALIEDGAMEQGGLAHIAQRLGVTDRHLRRVFMAQFGVTPIAYAQTQRLLLAKRLLTDTRLSVTEVALAAGLLEKGRLRGAPCQAATP